MYVYPKSGTRSGALGTRQVDVPVLVENGFSRRSGTRGIARNVYARSRPFTRTGVTCKARCTPSVRSNRQPATRPIICSVAAVQKARRNGFGRGVRYTRDPRAGRILLPRRTNTSDIKRSDSASRRRLFSPTERRCDQHAGPVLK